MWQHFREPKEGQEGATCSVCLAEVSTRGGNTSSMWGHLRRHHPSLLGNGEVPDDGDNPGMHKIKSRSLVWKYFRKTVPAMAVCNICGKDICTGEDMDVSIILVCFQLATTPPE